MIIDKCQLPFATQSMDAHIIYHLFIICEFEYVRNITEINENSMSDLIETIFIDFIKTQIRPHE